ncbi:hypothetical protein [Roseovarius sp. MBR-6]|uniref:hypothetical protein n=1 Tax=Roseovarius sp. MBR-6 TaxID=3156459 RepID=UPI003393D304
MTIRRHADIDEAALSSAEKTLLENCKAGVPTVLGDGTLPDGPSDARRVRADLLRYLICGGCRRWPVADSGVDLTGAYVTGTLDLDFATAKGATGLFACRFENPIEALQARFEFLNLSRSNMPGLMAQGARVTGNVFLRGVTAEGEVRLSEAMIGGQLACVGARFENAGGRALNAQGARVTGDVFLRGVTAKGEVSLAGAGIGGQLDCEDARFGNAEGKALIAQNMAAEDFYWRGVAAVSGAVDLNGAKVANLVDDAASWDLVGCLYLNGFRYESIHGPMTAQMRLGWVAKDAEAANEFRPQPYEQLASVFRAMGHDADRRAVLIEKENVERKHARARMRDQRRFARLVARASRTPSNESFAVLSEFTKSAQALDHGFTMPLLERFELFHLQWPQTGDGTTPPDRHAVAMAQAGFREQIYWQNAGLRARIAWNHFKDRMSRWLAGYGYQPFNFIWALLLLWAIGAGLAHQAWQAGDFAPNSDVILSTPEWWALAEDGAVANPAAEWSARHGKGRDWETFHAGAYAFDVVVPIVVIGQTGAWAPSTNRGSWGWHLWWVRWVLTVLGWIVTAVGAAAITGIIRRE